MITTPTDRLLLEVNNFHKYVFDMLKNMHDMEAIKRFEYAVSIKLERLKRKFNELKSITEQGEENEVQGF